MKRLIALLITALLTLPGISQTVSSDTGKTCLPNVQLHEAMRLNEIRKVQARELANTKDRVALLDSSIVIKDSIIASYTKKDVQVNRLIIGYDASIANLQQQNDLSTAWVNDLQKQLKVSKRKAFVNKLFYGFISAASLSVAGYLLITR